MKRNSSLHRLMLAVVILTGGLLRFYNLNWDSGMLFHPDEMNIGIAMSKISFSGSLNPGFFAYNGFSLYLYKAAATIVAAFTGNQSWVDETGRSLLVGRYISAAVSTFSLPMIYLLGVRIADRQTAFLATTLAAFNTGLIQCAHFAVTESLLVFFLLLTALCAQACIAVKSRICDGILYLVIGIAAGCKTSALSFLAFPAAVIAIRSAGLRQFFSGCFRAIPGSLIILAAFFAVSPYSLLELESFLASMSYEGGVVHGTIKVPYTLQFFDSTAFISWIPSLNWLLTVPVAVIGMTGLLVWLAGGLMALWRRNLCQTTPSELSAESNNSDKALPLLVFAMLYALYIGSWHAKFIRYLIPLLPVLILSSAWACGKIRKRFALLGSVVTVIVIVCSGLWAVSFFSIYLRPSTRIAASEWMLKNFNPESRLLLEHYDYPLPIVFPGNAPDKFVRRIFPFFAKDTPEKMQELAAALAEADYLILASRRLYANISRDTHQYPFTSRYYHDLFSGRLGFSEVAVFSSPPALGNWTFDDNRAEETFQVFDHPEVRIFRKDGNSEALCRKSVSEIAAFLTRPAENAVSCSHNKEL